MNGTRSVGRCGLVTAAMMTLWAMGAATARSDNAAVAREPVWVVDPATPGPDTPPAGASLFDEITTLPDGRRQVPFPFDKLIQRFEAAAGCSATASCVRSVLLPLGRSLQRVAASPDYFRFPRIVSGVVADGRGPWLLRDRLYVGYQERAGIVEIISYNETAQRFEFQQIKNYRAGAEPQVFQARRTVCVACHQNQAPIFPRQVWDETNANPLLIAKLGAERQSYFGVDVQGSTDIANALDDATDRSNRLALVQRLWREGCGTADEGARCRSAVFSAAVQFTLTERRAYDMGSIEFREAIETLQSNARRHWPAGLAVPNPDLPNRDPLAALNGADGLAASHVPAQLDPLLPRPALELLPPDGARLANVLVNGIADSLPSVDIDRLSDVLGLQAAKPPHRRTHRGRCEVRTTANITRFDCADGAELRGSFDGSFATIESLRIGSHGAIRNLRLPARRSAGHVLKITPKIRDRMLRLPDGNAVAELAIDSQAGVALTVSEDFSSLQPTLSEAIASAPRESPAQRLQRVVALLSGKTFAPMSNIEIGAATVEPVATEHDAIALTAPFESRCGSCHHTADTSPPNFLSGDARRVSQALQSCAPRIFVRLAMRELPQAQRQKTPMPPERAAADGHELRAVDVRVLTARVESLLKNEYGRVPQANELLSNGYENLRPCLPEGRL
jgi:hypothetical protein